MNWYLIITFFLFATGLMGCGYVWDDLENLEKEDYVIYSFLAAVAWPILIPAVLFCGVALVPWWLGKALRSLYSFLKQK